MTDEFKSITDQWINPILNPSQKCGSAFRAPA